MKIEIDERTRSSGSNRNWVVVCVIGAFVFLQWPSVQEIYYQIVGSPESKIAWQHEVDTAFGIATETDKPVLAVFGASWCPPCRTMKREVWADTRVADAVETGFVPLYIDVDDRTLSEFSSRYNVTSIPTVLVLDADGKIIRQRRSMSQTDTLAFLNFSAASKDSQ